MLQYLVLTALGEDAPRLMEQFSKGVRDCGCNIIDSRLTVLGGEFSLVMMVSGTWDAIAKIEDQLPKLSQELGLDVHSRRTKVRQPGPSLMPYAIDVVCCDRPGVVHDIAKFITDNELQIQDMYTNTYRALHTETPMFSLHMTVNVPVNVSISALRGDFMDFCDRLNLDAIIEPVK